jgi:hypothetical protein
MKLSRGAINELKEIYRKDYGVMLSDEQSTEIASSFFHLMKITYKPIPKDDEK